MTTALSSVLARIGAACRRSGREPGDVLLIAVTKGRDAETVRRLIVDEGHLVLGESRVQEWREKARGLADRGVEWHLIGHLQRNKVKYCADFRLIHSLDSERLADELERQGERLDHVFDVLVEVNVSAEPTKHGVDLARLPRFADYVLGLERVRLHGLMTMAPHEEDPEKSRPVFSALREARDRLGLVELSMGMSNDFEVAVEEGATMVRVGSALFEGEAA